MRSVFTTPSGESPATRVAANRIQARVCPDSATARKAQDPSLAAASHPDDASAPIEGPSAGGGGGAGIAGGAAVGDAGADSSAPQLEQNLESSGFSRPHLGHVTKAAPPRRAPPPPRASSPPSPRSSRTPPPSPAPFLASR